MSSLGRRVQQAAAGNVRYNGPDAVRYEDLYASGDTIRDVIGKVTGGKILTLPPGVFEFSDFAMSSQYGLLLPSGCKGIAGSGISQTVLRMTPGSSTQGGQVPDQSTGSTNPLYLIRVSSLTGGLFQQFKLEGTDQGHLYSGLMLAYATNPLVQDILVTATRGNWDAPPGETFAINVWHGSGMIGRRIEVDGRDDTGTRVSASPFGYNSTTGSTLYDCYSHHNLASTFTYWETTNCTTYRVRSEYNGNGSAGQHAHGFNHERSVSIVHHDPVINTDYPNNSGYHMSMNDDQEDGLLTVYNPTFNNDSRSPGNFIIWTGSTEAGNPQAITTKPVVWADDAGTTPLANYVWSHPS